MVLSRLQESQDRKPVVDLLYKVGFKALLFWPEHERVEMMAKGLLYHRWQWMNTELALEQLSVN